MREVILDSSVIIAYLNPYDSNHKEAVKILKSLIDNKDIIIILSSVVIEVLNVVKMKFKSYLFLAEEFFNFPNLNIISFDEFGNLKSCFKLFSENNNLSLVDVLELEYSQKREALLITFDKELKKYSIR